MLYLHVVVATLDTATFLTPLLHKPSCIVLSLFQLLPTTTRVEVVTTQLPRGKLGLLL